MTIIAVCHFSITTVRTVPSLHLLFALEYNSKVKWCRDRALYIYLHFHTIPALKRRLSVTNFSSENNLPTFWLKAPVVIRVKVKRCELFIAMHNWGYTSLEVKGREDCSWSSSSQKSSNQGLPVLYPGWSTPLRVSSGCAGPPSPLLVHTSSFSAWWQLEHSVETLASYLMSSSW